MYRADLSLRNRKTAIPTFPLCYTAAIASSSCGRAMALSFEWAALLVGMVLLARRGAWLVGPVLVFDAVRTARRARHALLRAGYAMLLLVAGVVTGGVFPLWAVAEVLALAVQAVFAVCLGMYCTLRSRTTLRATVATAVVLLLITVGHCLLLLVATVVCHALGKPELVRPLELFHAYGLTPPMTQMAFLIPIKDVLAEGPFAGERESITMAALGVLFYGGAASLFWGLLGAQFTAKTGRSR